MCGATRQLIDLDASGFDDRPPLFDVRLLRGGECCGRLLIARKDFLAEVGELGAHNEVNNPNQINASSV